jgi:hypothetical protein
MDFSKKVGDVDSPACVTRQADEIDVKQYKSMGCNDFSRQTANAEFATV